METMIDTENQPQQQPSAKAIRTPLLLVGGIMAAIVVSVLVATLAKAPTQTLSSKVRKETLADIRVSLAPRSLKVIPFEVRHEGDVDLSVLVSENGEVNVRVIDASEFDKAERHFSNPIFSRGYKQYQAFYTNDISTTAKHSPFRIQGGRLPKGKYCAILVNENYLFSHDAAVSVVAQ